MKNPSILKIDIDIIDETVIKEQIINWIRQNTHATAIRISDKPNKDGEYIVNARYVCMGYNT